MLREVETAKQQQLTNLQAIAKLSQDEAKELILKSYQKRLSRDVAQLISDAEKQAKAQAEEKARDILVEAMRHGATEYVAEYTVSLVKVKDEDVKGRIIHREGEQLCHSVKVFNLPVEISDILGRFKYRFSYGQNMIQHTLEETRIGVALAHELKADVNVVRLACLLHDIGKVIVDKEGSHVQLGVELLKKHRFPASIVEAVETHHEDKDFTSTEGIIVYLADAVSGG